MSKQLDLALKSYRANRRLVESDIENIARAMLAVNIDSDTGLFGDGLFDIIPSLEYHTYCAKHGNADDETQFLNALCIAVLSANPRYDEITQRLLEISLKGL